MSGLCPCGGQYQRCCEPFHNDQSTPSTAEQLMRSRYSAYALGLVDYLVATLHPTQRSPGLRESLKQSCRSMNWVKLTIVRCEHGNEDDREGLVEFRALYRADEVGLLHESSRFVKESGRWFYLDGEQQPPPQLGRNELCWCDSGKKFKKCHGTLQ